MAINLNIVNDNELLKSEFMEFVESKGCRYYNTQGLLKLTADLKESTIEKGIGGNQEELQKSLQQVTKNLDPFIVVDETTGNRETFYIEKSVY
jgi:hypothetical protein